MVHVVVMVIVIVSVLSHGGGDDDDRGDEIMTMMMITGFVCSRMQSVQHPYHTGVVPANLHLLPLHHLHPVSISRRRRCRPHHYHHHLHQYRHPNPSFSPPLDDEVMLNVLGCRLTY